jgi:ribonuclease HI
MPARPRKVYVVTAPAAVRGIYQTWAACEAAVRGIAGARYQAVGSREEAEAMLAGRGRTLTPGWWAFVDGNHAGGIGVVLVHERADGTRAVQERASTVETALVGAGIAGLDTATGVRRQLGRLRNVLAELGALWVALGQAAPGAPITIVHDYEGVGAWLDGRWKAKDPVVAAIVAACRGRIAERRLEVTFVHQPGHRSTWAGRDDFAELNARADLLASEGVRRR